MSPLFGPAGDGELKWYQNATPDEYGLVGLSRHIQIDGTKLAHIAQNDPNPDLRTGHSANGITSAGPTSPAE